MFTNLTEESRNVRKISCERILKTTRLILSALLISGVGYSVTLAAQKSSPLPKSALTSTSLGGYWMAGADGSTYNFGTLALGSAAPYHPVMPIVGMAATPDGHGYWEVASDGGIFSFGDATFYGSMGGKPLNKPIVGMAATPDGKGYWLVASDGGIFSFGDATFYGSMGGKTIPGPIVSIASDMAVNPFIPHTTGYDMSNYTTSIPPSVGNIAIAESDGYPFLVNRNPTIFKEEAAAAGANLQLYSFLGAPFSAGTWQIAPTASVYLDGPAGTCAPTNYLCQSTNYGWNEAQHSLESAKSFGISSNIWWLDIETGGPWSTDTQINSLVIQGAMQYLHSQGALVGLYSTAHQWSQITGGLMLGSATNTQPIWIAAPDYQQTACTDTALWFAGGTPWLIQTGENYTYNVGTDYAC